MGPNSFVFADIFMEKRLCWRSTPPNGFTPPREILDPPQLPELKLFHFSFLCIYMRLIKIQNELIICNISDNEVFT